MAWIPPKGPDWIVSRISVLLCGDDLQFGLRLAHLAIDWVRLCICFAKFYQYEHTSTYLSASRFLCQRWTTAPWIPLFHPVFPSTPFVSHLRNWAHQCILSWMQPTLDFGRLSSAVGSDELCRWVVSSTWHSIYWTLLQHAYIISIDERTIIHR